MEITKYGLESFAWLTDDIDAARERAKRENSVLVAYTFEYVHSEPIEDYRVLAFDEGAECENAARKLGED